MVFSLKDVVKTHFVRDRIQSNNVLDLSLCHKLISSNTVVGDNINIMKTTFELNFDFYQAFKQYGYTQKYGNKEKLSIKKASL